MSKAPSSRPAVAAHDARQARILSFFVVLLAASPLIAGGAIFAWRQYFDPHRPRKVCTTHYEGYSRTTMCTYYEYNPSDKQMEETGKSY